MTRCHPRIDPYKVAGPVALFLTTTAVDVDEELLNRCIVLSVDEDRAQTRAIHDRQRARQTLEGLLADQERARIVKLHKDAQRLLRPVLVANPYAPRLGFADEATRSRRDHMKYLTLIRAIALLHQHQRPTRTVTHGGEAVTYIEVTLDDIALANRLAHEVLGRSLDELAPQTRRLLGHIDALVANTCRVDALKRTDVRFTRRAVREHCAGRTSRCAPTWSAWSASSTCWCTGAGGARASSTSCSTTAAAPTDGPTSSAWWTSPSWQRLPHLWLRPPSSSPRRASSRGQQAPNEPPTGPIRDHREPALDLR